MSGKSARQPANSEDFGMKTGTAPGSYNPSTKKITFNDYANISSATLKEELFHAWQDAYYPGGIAQYSKDAQGNKLPGYVNVEFEAKFYKDLLDNPEMYNGCCYAFRPGEVDNLPLNLYNDYTEWIYNIRDNKTTLQDSDYQKWLNLFNQYNTEYSSPIHANLLIPKALKNLISNSKCF